MCTHLIKTKDRSGGIAVIMGEKATYKSLVNVLDASEWFDNRISIVPYGDKIYLYFPRSKSGSASPEENGPWPFICGLVLSKNELTPASDKSESLSLLKAFWPTLIPLTLMVFFALQKRSSLKANIL